MENDNEIILNEENDLKTENIFHLDYKGQALKSTKKFITWKNRMLEKYGNNAKLFKCIYENAYFYVSKKDFNNMHLYKSICPSCNRKICYFCSRALNSDYDPGNCCVKRRILYMIYEDGLALLDSQDYSREFIQFLFPFLTLFFIIGIISKNLYHTLRVFKNNIDYDYYFKDDTISWLKVFINGLIAFMLSIPFIIHDIYLKIFLLFISIFSKNIPIKYYLGILNRGFE